MQNTKDYTDEEILDALETLKNQYNSEPLYVLMHGVPQLVERCRRLQSGPVSIDWSETKDGIGFVVTARENVVVHGITYGPLGKAASDPAYKVSLSSVSPHDPVSQPDGHADPLENLREYGGSTD